MPLVNVFGCGHQVQPVQHPVPRGIHSVAPQQDVPPLRQELDGGDHAVDVDVIHDVVQAHAREPGLQQVVAVAHRHPVLLESLV